MAERIVDLLRSNYDEKHGVVNVRPVVDQLLRTSSAPFAEVSASFETAESRWRLPILEAMRVLAASGHCTENDVQGVLRATESVAAESGADEYFKSVNALVASPKTAGALTGFVSRLLDNPRRDFERRLAFYTIGMLLEHRTAKLPDGLRGALRTAADAEGSDQLRRQFVELLGRL